VALRKSFGSFAALFGHTLPSQDLRRALIPAPATGDAGAVGAALGELLALAGREGGRMLALAAHAAPHLGSEDGFQSQSPEKSSSTANLAARTAAFRGPLAARDFRDPRGEPQGGALPGASRTGRRAGRAPGPDEAAAPRTSAGAAGSGGSSGSRRTERCDGSDGNSASSHRADQRDPDSLSLSLDLDELAACAAPCAPHGTSRKRGQVRPRAGGTDPALVELKRVVDHGSQPCPG
jgi:hypothetical protein